MSVPSSGYDYTFVRVEDFDYAKKISIAEGCNKTVKTLYPPEDKLTTPNMCVSGVHPRSTMDRVPHFSRLFCARSGDFDFAWLCALSVLCGQPLFRATKARTTIYVVK